MCSLLELVLVHEARKFGGLLSWRSAPVKFSCFFILLCFHSAVLFFELTRLRAERCSVELTIFGALQSRLLCFYQFSYFRERMLRWWVTNIFSGVEKLPIGIHEDGLVTKIQTYMMSEIPALVKASNSICVGYCRNLRPSPELSRLRNLSNFAKVFSTSKPWLFLV